MMLAGKYAMLDWNTMKLQSEARGEAKGEDKMVKAIMMLHNGSTEEDLRNAGFSEKTIKKALLCK